MTAADIGILVANAPAIMALLLVALLAVLALLFCVLLWAMLG